MPVQRVVITAGGTESDSGEATRYQRWFDEFRATVGGREITPAWDRPFAARVEYLPLGSVALSRSTGSVRIIERRPEHVRRDGDDRFILVVNRGRHPSQAHMGRRIAEVPPGAATLFDFAAPSRHAYPQEHSSLSLHLPRRQFCAGLPSAEDAAGVVIAKDNEALRLICLCAGALLGDDNLSEPTVLAHAGQHLSDLAMLVDRL